MDSRCVVNSTTLWLLIKAVITKPGQGDVLEENGGSFKIGKTWICQLCQKLELSMRKSTTAAYKLPSDFEKRAHDFMLRLSYCVFMMDIPKEAVANMDQTGIHLVPKSSFTRARVGAKEIPLIGQDDKRQITLVPPVAADGTMLPCQVIMKGQTERTLPLISSHKISGMEG